MSESKDKLDKEFLEDLELAINQTVWNAHSAGQDYFLYDNSMRKNNGELNSDDFANKIIKSRMHQFTSLIQKLLNDNYLLKSDVVKAIRESDMIIDLPGGYEGLRDIHRFIDGNKLNDELGLS